PEKISLEKLLEVFFTVAHDPTQLNRQGPDVGPHYRSAIFYKDDAQLERVKNYMDALKESGAIKGKIVTTLEPLEAFYVAEDYHQDYVQCNLNNPYVNAQALPKIDKVRKKYEELVRD
ncbi:MAG: peptide-methionine (S)-S-oxide reductase, partial [Rhodospirillales bacterium]|nr:peptide-methionine (S)-S-oxide reductase [Rhodospirillales bacterium]